MSHITYMATVFVLPSASICLYSLTPHELASKYAVMKAVLQSTKPNFKGQYELDLRRAAKVLSANVEQVVDALQVGSSLCFLILISILAF